MGVKEMLKTVTETVSRVIAPRAVAEAKKLAEEASSLKTESQATLTTAAERVLRELEERRLAKSSHGK